MVISDVLELIRQHTTVEPSTTFWGASLERMRSRGITDEAIIQASKTALGDKYHRGKFLDWGLKYIENNFNTLNPPPSIAPARGEKERYKPGYIKRNQLMYDEWWKHHFETYGEEPSREEKDRFWNEHWLNDEWVPIPEENSTKQEIT